MRQGSEVYQKLKSLAKKEYGQSAGNVGDEGGVAPDIETADEALTLITNAIEQAGYTGKVKIAMDVASSEFYKTDAKKYDLDFKNPESDPEKWVTYEQLADQYRDLAKKYPIVSIEDPFGEEDWEAWSYFKKDATCQIVGDDLTVTNPTFIKKAIDTKACDALLLKVNQIGTISEAIQAAKDAFEKWNGFHEDAIHSKDLKPRATVSTIHSVVSVNFPSAANNIAEENPQVRREALRRVEGDLWRKGRRCHPRYRCRQRRRLRVLEAVRHQGDSRLKDVARC